MNDFKDSAMIALLPIMSDWCKIELPHMTLVYAGEIKDLKSTDFNEMAKDSAAIAMAFRSQTLNVMGLEVFGDEEKVDVLKLQPTTELLSMRRFVEHWNASEHPFNPHVTIGPQGSAEFPIPRLIAFNRIAAYFGEEQLVFWLKGYSL